MNLLSRRRALLMKLKKLIKTIAGAVPLTLSGTTGEPLVNYRLEGNSYQATTPTPEAPVEIESVGTLTDDGKYKIPVVAQGKNLFDINNTSNWNSDNYYYYPIYVGANKTITASWDGDLTTGQNFYLNIGNKSSQIGNGNAGGGQWLYHKTSTGLCRQYVNIKADSEGYIYVNISPYSTASLNRIKNLQIEYGSTVTNYEPYKEPIITNIYLDEPLRKVGNYADYIDFANGKVVRNIGYSQMLSKYGLTQSASSNTTTTIATVYGSSPFGKAKINTKGLGGFCNIGRVCYGSDLINSGSVFWGYNTNTVTFFGVPNALLNELGFENSLEGVKSYIDYQNNITPIMIAFVLATPTEELIELPQLPTLQGTTVYTTDTTIQASKMKATYYR